MIWWTIPILIFAFWLYLKVKRTAKHISIIGKKVRVDYFDQNTNFETIFPLTGTITNKIRVGNQDFFTLQFDKSFCYENKDFDKIVIRERHAGHYIGDNGEIHVHVLLPKRKLTQDYYELTDFDHVVWATIKNI